MPDDKLRIGGWVPNEAQDTRQLPVLVTRPSPPMLADRATELVPLGPERRPRRVIVLCAVAVVAGTVGMLALLRPSGDKTVQPPIAGPMVFATPSAQATTTEPPAPTYTEVVPPAGGITDAPAPTTKPAAAKTSVPATPSHKPTQATTPSLTPGSTIGLALADDSGQRVRHENFTIRLDRLSSRSSASDRASSRYTVRRGLASSGCLSFEAVDHPGYYLRHRVFDMVLDRRDNSTIFDQESTFCAVPAGNKAFTLVTFYPSRDYVVAAGRDGTLQVTYASMSRGTTFVVRAPL
jgi:hypothetical protein